MTVTAHFFPRFGPDPQKSSPEVTSSRTTAVERTEDHSNVVGSSDDAKLSKPDEKKMIPISRQTPRWSRLRNARRCLFPGAPQTTILRSLLEGCAAASTAAVANKQKSYPYSLQSNVAIQVETPWLNHGYEKLRKLLERGYTGWIWFLRQFQVLCMTLFSMFTKSSWSQSKSLCGVVENRSFTFRMRGNKPRLLEINKTVLCAFNHE